MYQYLLTHHIVNNTNSILQNNILNKVFVKSNVAYSYANIERNINKFFMYNENIIKMNEHPKINQTEPGFIYLLIHREFINIRKNIYKIGKSIQNDNKRINSYPKGTIPLLQVRFKNCSLAENILITIFKNVFIQETDYGVELFKGDFNIMKQYINVLSEMNCFKMSDLYC